jgi:mono/diheme cytochrome c family protein
MSDMMSVVGNHASPVVDAGKGPIYSSNNRRVTRMKCSLGVVACLLAWLGVAAAQQADSLSDTQQTGRLLFEQSCGVCHTRPTLTSPLYGPALSRETLGGQTDVMSEVISNGTPRMPGFKHLFDRTQIDAIVAYLKTMPKPAESIPR